VKRKADDQDWNPDWFLSCPCGHGDYHLCRKCPYRQCSVHGDKGKDSGTWPSPPKKK
jgi:hypothetical protein